MNKDSFKHEKSVNQTIHKYKCKKNLQLSKYQNLLLNECILENCTNFKRQG